jgi:hypothetical protein
MIASPRTIAMNWLGVQSVLANVNDGNDEAADDDGNGEATNDCEK